MYTSKCLKKQASNNSPVSNISASHLATVCKIETTLSHKKSLFDPPCLNLQPDIFREYTNHYTCHGPINKPLIHPILIEKLDTGFKLTCFTISTNDGSITHLIQCYPSCLHFFPQLLKLLQILLNLLPNEACNFRIVLSSSTEKVPLLRSALK